MSEKPLAWANPRLENPGLKTDPPSPRADACQGHSGAARCWGHKPGHRFTGCCCPGSRQRGDRAVPGQPQDGHPVLGRRTGSGGRFSEKLLPPKVEYESGFGATLITAGSIGLARPSKIQSQPQEPSCSALCCLAPRHLPPRAWPRVAPIPCTPASIQAPQHPSHSSLAGDTGVFAPLGGFAMATTWGRELGSPQPRTRGCWDPTHQPAPSPPQRTGQGRGPGDTQPRGQGTLWGALHMPTDGQGAPPIPCTRLPASRLGQALHK